MSRHTTDQILSKLEAWYAEQREQRQYSYLTFQGFDRLLGEDLSLIDLSSETIKQKAKKFMDTRQQHPPWFFVPIIVSKGEQPGLDLSGALLSENVYGKRIDLSLVQLQGANLRDAQLQGAKLWQAQLQGANLCDAHLEEAHLDQARLKGAFLRDAKLQGAKLWDAKLQEAYLYNVQLQGADLCEAKLQGADHWRQASGGRPLGRPPRGGAPKRGELGREKRLCLEREMPRENRDGLPRAEAVVQPLWPV
jgi:uncharacterized protein YjbI with pentapeptide repeats